MDNHKLIKVKKRTTKIEDIEIKVKFPFYRYDTCFNYGRSYTKVISENLSIMVTLTDKGYDDYGNKVAKNIEIEWDENPLNWSSDLDDNYGLTNQDEYKNKFEEAVKTVQKEINSLLM